MLKGLTTFPTWFRSTFSQSAWRPIPQQQRQQVSCICRAAGLCVWGGHACMGCYQQAKDIAHLVRLRVQVVRKDPAALFASRERKRTYRKEKAPPPVSSVSLRTSEVRARGEDCRPSMTSSCRNCGPPGATWSAEGSAEGSYQFRRTCRRQCRSAEMMGTHKDRPGFRSRAYEQSPQ